MALVLDAPADFVQHLLSQWLTLRNICDLEEAVCSAENRLRLGTVYESMVLSCNKVVEKVATMEMQLEWLVVRSIRVSSLHIGCTLPRSALSKVSALLKHSATNLVDLTVYENDPSLTTIVTSISRYCTEVKRLNVSNMTLSLPFFTMLNNLRNLKELIFDHCDQLDVEHMKGALCPSVQRLTLQAYNMRYYSIQIQEEVLRMCPNLLHYHLITDLVELRNMPATLESLIVEGSTIQIVNLNTNLKKLKVACYFSGDEEIEGMFTSCLHLQELSVSGTSGVTEATLIRIADAYSQTLTSLNISGMNQLSHSAVKYMCEKCSKLTRLKLGGFDAGFQPSCIITALDHRPTLRELSITSYAYDSTISDEVLTRIAAAPLESLHIPGDTCSERGIKALIDGCASLKRITIRDDLISPLVKFLWQKVRPDLEFR